LQEGRGEREKGFIPREGGNAVIVKREKRGGGRGGSLKLKGKRERPASFSSSRRKVWGWIKGKRRNFVVFNDPKKKKGERKGI